MSVLNTKALNRRRLLAEILMWGSLTASYGLLLLLGVRYLYPSKGVRRIRRIYLAAAEAFPPGRSALHTLPGGTQALVTHTGTEIVALSNICPHLGCKVHWESQNNRFYCPCHGGVFDSQGIAREGPPASEGQNLKSYTITQIGNSLFLEQEEIIQL